MKYFYLYGLAIIAGGLIPIQAATNVVLNKVTGHVLYSSFILFCVGLALITLFILIFRLILPTVQDLTVAPLYSYTGGVIVTIYVLSITFLAPRIGVGSAVLLIVTGQIVSAALIDHFGWFGLKVYPLTINRLVGFGCMIMGLVMVSRS